MRLFIGAAFLVRLSMGAALPPAGGYRLDKKSWQLKAWWFK